MALTIYTYLDSVSVRSACMDYIDYLHAENDAYKTIKTRIENFINDTDSTSSSIVGIKDQMDDYSLIIQELMRANEFDIDSCWKLHDNSGSGVYDGYTIFKNKNEASGNYSFNYDKGEEYAKKAYNETNDSLKEEYGKKASDYYGIAREIKKELEYWEGREAEYDEIESCTANCFQESVELRSRAMTGLGEISTSFNKGEYARKNSAWRDEIKDDLAKDVILDLRVNPDRADITLNIITDEEIKELIALQMAPYDYLPQAQKDRLKELEDLLLVSNPGAWATYYSLAGSLDNDSVRLLIERLKGEGFSTDFVYQGGSNLATAADQYATFKELHELYPTNNYYANMCILYEQKYYEELDAAFESLPRSEDFAAAYQYLRDTNTDPREMAEILDYWAQFEDGDSLENCMPPSWVAIHLSDPGLVTEENVLDSLSSEELQEWYFQGYYIVELINGQPYSIFDSPEDVYNASMTDRATLYGLWCDYMYGGMYDYVYAMTVWDGGFDYEGTNRAVKYFLSTYYGVPNLTETNGYYTVYTSEQDDYYRICVDAYLHKEGYYEDFYDGVFTNEDWGKQLMHYIRFDDGYEPLTEDEVQFLTDYYQVLVTTGVPPYRSVSDIQDWLEHDNTINGIDIQTAWDPERHVITVWINAIGKDPVFIDIPVEADGCTDILGTTYIDAAAVQNALIQYAVLKQESGVYGGLEAGFREDEVYAMLESMAEEMGYDLSSLTEDELQQMRDYVRIILDSYYMYNGAFLTDRVRDVEGFNDATKEMLLGLAVAAALCSGFGAPVTIAVAGFGIMVGGVMIAQGDGWEGVWQIAKSAVSICKAAGILENSKFYEIFDAVKSPFGYVDSKTQEFVFDAMEEALRSTIVKDTYDTASSIIGTLQSGYSLYKKVWEDQHPGYELDLPLDGGIADWAKFFFSLDADERAEFVKNWNEWTHSIFPFNANASDADVSAFLQNFAYEDYSASLEG